MGVGVAVVMETKVTAAKHTRFLSGYRVLALSAPSVQRGGITLLWKEEHAAFEVKAAWI